MTDTATNTIAEGTARARTAAPRAPSEVMAALASRQRPVSSAAATEARRKTRGGQQERRGGGEARKERGPSEAG